MDIRFVNMWKYWKSHGTRDFTLIDLTFHDSLLGGGRFMILNFGFILSPIIRNKK